MILSIVNNLSDIMKFLSIDDYCWKFNNYSHAMIQVMFDQIIWINQIFTFHL